MSGDPREPEDPRFHMSPELAAHAHAERERSVARAGAAGVIDQPYLARRATFDPSYRRPLPPSVPNPDRRRR